MNILFPVTCTKVMTIWVSRGVQSGLGCNPPSPVYSPLLQVCLVVAMLAVFSNQFMGVGLVRCVFGHQGDANSQRTVVIIHLTKEHTAVMTSSSHSSELLGRRADG